MPRFFFNIRDHGRLVIDEEGLDLPDADEARIEAEASAIDLLRDAMAGQEDIAHQTIEVTDDDGHAVVTVVLREYAVGINPATSR